MMLLATLSVPVVTKFDFMHATFENGEVMRAGIWGKRHIDIRLLIERKGG